MRQTIFVLFLVLIFFSSCTKSIKNKPTIQKGVLDLTSWDLEKNGSVGLNGEWEFYWNQLLTSDNFKDSSFLAQEKHYFEVYKLWNNDTVGGMPLNFYGYATYRLIVKFSDTEKQNLAIRVPTFATSCKIFIDGMETSTSGIVGKTKEEASPAYTPHVADFFRDSSEVEIIMQVSNFYHKKGGTWHVVEIGTELKLNEERTNTIIVDIFLLGSILIMSLYHFGLFFLRRKDKYTLYFALFSLFVSLRVVTTGEYLLGHFDFINWNLLIRAEYLSFYSAELFFSAFLISLFPKEFSKYVFYFLLGTCILFISSVLFTPPIFFSHFVMIFQAVLLLMSIYTIYVLILGIVRKREGAIPFLFGFGFFFITLINDLLYNNEVIDTGNYFSLGVFVFLFSQAFLISSRFSNAFKKTELLTEELNFYNQNLEKIVKERTAEIEQQKEEILAQKEEVQSINDELQTLNQELEKLSIVARETDNSIVILDKEGNIIWINDGFTKLYGYTYEEYILKFGKNLIKVSTNENVCGALTDCINLKKSVTYESFALTKQNATIWLQTTLTPIFDDNHEVIKVVGIETNISKLKEFEQEILQKNEEILAQKDELEIKNNQIQEQNEHINASIRYAQTIQNAILPTHEKLDSLFENFLIFKPKDIVSGDFYWLNHLSEKKERNLTEKIFISVVDCTGHGVPGAFMSMIANRLLSEIVNEKLIHSPCLILEELDKSIRKTLNQDHTDNKDGMDLSICVIENKFNGERILTFCGAKRPVYYYNSAINEMKIIEPTRRSLGGYLSKIDKKFENTIINLNSGDILVLSSDGFGDQNNIERKRFSASQLARIIEVNIKLDMKKQKEIIENAFNKWIEGTTQRDDITILSIKI